MGGGPSQSQKDAAARQADLASTLGNVANREQQFKEDQQNKVNPFYTSRMTNGLPFFPAMVDYSQGTIARSFAPARAALQRRLSTAGPLPSGFREQALSDFDAAKARAFDDSLVGALSANEQAKQSGASGLLGQAQIAAPQGYYNAAMSGNQSIMQAPLQSPGVAGLLGGLAGGAVSAIPF